MELNYNMISKKYPYSIVKKRKHKSKNNIIIFLWFLKCYYAIFTWFSKYYCVREENYFQLAEVASFFLHPFYAGSSEVYRQLKLDL